jgi:hypothetical protein
MASVVHDKTGPTVKSDSFRLRQPRRGKILTYEPSASSNEIRINKSHSSKPVLPPVPIIVPARQHLLGCNLLHPIKHAQLDPVRVCEHDGLCAALLTAAGVGVLVALPGDVWQILLACIRTQHLPVKPSVLQEHLSHSVFVSGLQLQFSYTLAYGHKPPVRPALLLGTRAGGRSRFVVNQPSGGRGAAHHMWSGTH